MILAFLKFTISVGVATAITYSGCQNLALDWLSHLFVQVSVDLIYKIQHTTCTEKLKDLVHCF